MTHPIRATEVVVVKVALVAALAGAVVANWLVDLGWSPFGLHLVLAAMLLALVLVDSGPRIYRWAMGTNAGDTHTQRVGGMSGVGRGGHGLPLR